MIESLIALLALCALGWYWQDSAHAREFGVAAARAACARENLQFLDDSVAQRGLRWVRNAAGRLTLQRSYAFEYSVTGDDRQPGLVVLQDREVVLLQLSPATRSPGPMLH
ncbi:DUF3301 domain-containing protein [Uliginosibacterium aquaticum]|uniref:DUF3301 domain-containing protein n=1 Tax=Uliginosibacterium aquaticum TaxID=2731212 RepID=A0ABX2IID7_9RHOO|nr:DUF3301 domain-containing protein [Uliginosibacterium aquaticum]NSL56583.1 DUF3301 domain-containing protein [Uliginosibacterium aquaticum]